MVKDRDPLSRQAAWFDPCFEPLVAVRRGTVVESVHRGGVAVVDSRGDLLGGVGDPSTTVFLRSAAKPFQALAVVDSGAADAFDISQQELAVICGSHAGRPEHVRVVEGLVSRLGVDPEELVCSLPAASETSGTGPAISPPAQAGSILQHNCSGKHAGMAALALHLGAPVKGYQRLQHPVQQGIAKGINSLLARRPGGPPLRFGVGSAPFAGVAPGGLLSGNSVFAGLDGCGVPVVRLSLRDAALLYALLAAGATPGLARVRDAMLAYPEMVAGEGCLDTRIMQAASGRVIAKGGAEGVQALALLRVFDPDPGAEAAIGCVFKVEDGSRRPLPLLAGSFLRAHELAEASAKLESAYPSKIEDILGREAGYIASVLEDDDLRRREARPGEGDLEGPGELRELGSPDDFSELDNLASLGELGDLAALGRVGGDEWLLGTHGRDVKLVVGRGDEKDIYRFLRTEWPAADEETFGKPVEWNAEPMALILRRRRQVVAVLKGHFLGGVGSVDELLVGRGQRGMGAGSALLRRFENEAAKRGCTRLVLRAVKGSKAEAFYRDRGYCRESVQLSYEFGRDYVRLTRRLRRAGDDV